MFNIVELCRIKYPDQVEAKNIGFKQNSQESRIEISKWEVPGIPEPSLDKLYNDLIKYEDQFKLNMLKESCERHLSYVLEKKAKSMGYDSSLSLVSYVDSTNKKWAQEATDYISWRDRCWEYAETTQNNIQTGLIRIPSEKEFVEGVPQ